MKNVVWMGILAVIIIALACVLFIFFGRSTGGTEYTIHVGLENKTIIVPSGVDLNTDEGACWLAKEAAKIADKPDFQCDEISGSDGTGFIQVANVWSPGYAFVVNINLNDKEINFAASP